MTVADVETCAEKLITDFAINPKAWVLLANPVWGRSETMNWIALFDTEEAARSYELASRLLSAVTTPDGIHRQYRPDSLLYDYNQYGMRLDPMFPWTKYDGVAKNPTPPSGAMPKMGLLARPRYGVDYDVGFGPGPGGYENRDAETPSRNRA
jgi:hypothetical protein